MPKTIPFVSELDWKATSSDKIDFGNTTMSRSFLMEHDAERFWVSPYNAWFTESCRQKLLKAMDDFGKVEEPEFWHRLTEWKMVSGINKDFRLCLLDLRSRLDALEGKGKP